MFVHVRIKAHRCVTVVCMKTQRSDIVLMDINIICEVRWDCIYLHPERRRGGDCSSFPRLFDEVKSVQSSSALSADIQNCSVVQVMAMPPKSCSVHPPTTGTHTERSRRQGMKNDPAGIGRLVAAKVSS